MIRVLALSLCFTSFFALGCDKGSSKASPKTKEQYTQYCAQCHEAGAANAPRRGDEQAWQKRNRKGADTLLKNVKKGLVAMPPMGGCEDCSDEDLRALIEYLAE